MTDLDYDKLKRILGIDYGKKRIGLAICDPLLTFGYPYQTIINDRNLFKNLKQIIQKQNIKKIILGYPNELKKSPTSITKDILTFKDKLIKEYKLEVILWDEKYTSAIAKEKVLQSVNKKSKRRDKGLLDQNSAAIILQEYLDEYRSKQGKIDI